MRGKLQIDCSELRADAFSTTREFPVYSFYISPTPPKALLHLLLLDDARTAADPKRFFIRHPFAGQKRETRNETTSGEVIFRVYTGFFFFLRHERFRCYKRQRNNRNTVSNKTFRLFDQIPFCVLASSNAFLDGCTISPYFCSHNICPGFRTYIVCLTRVENGSDRMFKHYKRITWYGQMIYSANGCTRVLR